jgi:hypothetical protein
MSALSAPIGEPVAAFDLPSDPLELTIECHRRGWTDGLPVIPPTRDRVDAMVAASGRDPMEVVGVLPPRQGVATVEAVAVSAVLAGCEPKHFEAVLAAVAATADPQFNLAAVNATTHPVAQFILLSGPAARAANVHAGSGCFGPGFRGNMSIGRALRLVQMSVAGAWPGTGDRATMGSPAKIAFCAAEREDATPWAPYHTTLGKSADAYCVTVFPCEGPANIQDHNSESGEGILKTIAGAMGHAGHNHIVGHRADPVLAMSPEHAATVAGDGYSRADVQRYIFENARFPANRLSAEFLKGMKPLHRELEELLPIARTADQIQIFVAGGPGKHCMFLPAFSGKQVCVEWTPHKH